MTKQHDSRAAKRVVDASLFVEASVRSRRGVRSPARTTARSTCLARVGSACAAGAALAGIHILLARTVRAVPSAAMRHPAGAGRSDFAET